MQLKYIKSARLSALNLLFYWPELNFFHKLTIQIQELQKMPTEKCFYRKMKNASTLFGCFQQFVAGHFFGHPPPPPRPEFYLNF